MAPEPPARAGSVIESRLMRFELIAAGLVKPRNARPPFQFVDQRSKNVVEITWPQRAATDFFWEEQSVMTRAAKLLQVGVLRQEDYAAVKRWHDGWPRRLARWIVSKLQRYC